MKFRVTIRWQLLLGIFILHLSQPFISFADVLVISSNDENKALLVDPLNFRLLAALPTGKGPHDIAVSPDGRYAYIANTGSQEEPGHTITVLDLKQSTVRTTFDLGSFKHPHDLKVSRDGRLLWVTCPPSKAVLEIDTQRGSIIRNWQLDRDGAWMLVVTPDERKIYTANIDDRSVSIIDRKANTVRSIPFNSSQIGIDTSPNGREVWVHHTDTSQISVIEVATDKVVATFASHGNGAGRLKFTPDGKRVLVAHGRSRNLVVFDAASRKMIESVPLSASPKVLTVSSDSKSAFVTCPSDDQTIMIDLGTRKQIAVFPTGQNPDGIAWAATRKGNNR